MSDLTDKTMKMLRFNHGLTKKYNGKLSFGVGNCFAKLVFVIPEFDNEFIYLLERLLPKFNIDVPDVYITPFYKFHTDDMELLNRIFDKEMSIVEPFNIIAADNIKMAAPKTYIFENIPELTEVIRIEKSDSYNKKLLIKKQKYIISRLNEIIKEI